MREKNDEAERIVDLLYADDHAIIADSLEDLQNSLEDWNGILTNNGMKISKEKSEVCCYRECPRKWRYLWKAISCISVGVSST